MVIIWLYLLKVLAFYNIILLWKWSSKYYSINVYIF